MREDEILGARPGQPERPEEIRRALALPLLIEVCFVDLPVPQPRFGPRNFRVQLPSFGAK